MLLEMLQSINNQNHAASLPDMTISFRGYPL